MEFWSAHRRRDKTFPECGTAISRPPSGSGRRSRFRYLGALFGRTTVYASAPKSRNKLIGKVLEIATGEIGVCEDPPGSNKGKRIGEYQRAVGIDSGEPWCVAFVFFCFANAARVLKIKNPMEEADCKTGSVLDLWNRARRAKGVTLVLHDDALNDPSQGEAGNDLRHLDRRRERPRRPGRERHRQSARNH